MAGKKIRRKHKFRENFELSEDRQKEYQGIYDKLVKDYLGDKAITRRALQDAMLQKAIDGCSRAYWQKLKTAVVYVQATMEGGAYKKYARELHLVEYPEDKVPEKSGKADSKVVKEIEVKQRDKIFNYFNVKINEIDKRLDDLENPLSDRQFDKLEKEKHSQQAVLAVAKICEMTGCRVEEAFKARFDDEGNLFIEGGKKRADRGSDRTLKLKMTPLERMELKVLIGRLEESPIDLGAIQKRFMRGASKALYRTNAENLPTLKSFRHQFASNLKVAIRDGSLSKAEAAYILGHQSEDSINVYGSSKTANGAGLKVEPAEGTEAEIEQVRAPSEELMKEVERLKELPIGKMSENIFNDARDNLSQNIKENNVARQSPSSTAIDFK
jgi:integrase